MARITVEDCLEKVPNRFALVLLTADRAKDLLKKTTNPLIDDYRDNKEVVTALREIAEGAVKIKENTLKLKSVEEEAEELKEDAAILGDVAEFDLDDDDLAAAEY